MQQVRACDFCGEDATGVYEPYPPSIPDSPRLLLCDRCRDRLASVVEPLTARIEGAGGTAADDAAGTAGAGADTGPTRPGSTPDDERAVADDGGDSTPAPTAEAPDASPSTTDPDEDGVEGGGRPVSDRRNTPPGYRKVMRFLENRELPVPREDAEDMTAEAYDLSPEAVAEAIDHAVQYGRLREVGGDLKR